MLVKEILVIGKIVRSHIWFLNFVELIYKFRIGAILLATDSNGEIRIGNSVVVSSRTVERSLNFNSNIENSSSDEFYLILLVSVTSLAFTPDSEQLEKVAHGREETA